MNNKRQRNWLFTMLMLVIAWLIPQQGWAQSHSYNFKGFCTDEDCTEKYQPAELNVKDDWYEISNAGQLYWFANEVDNGRLTTANVRLINDIIDNDVVFSYDAENDYAPIATDANGKDVKINTLRIWNPIGEGLGSKYIPSEEDRKKWFGGFFDGNGFSISGLYFNDISASCGLFESLYMTAKVENVKILNSYMKANVTASIVAYLEGSKINNCYNESILCGKYAAGGIVAEAIGNYYSVGALSGDLVRNSANRGLIYAAECIGGIIADSYDVNNTFSCLYNTGSLIHSSNTQYIGAILGFKGYGSGPRIKYCYACSDFDLVGGGGAIISQSQIFPITDFHNGKVVYQLSLIDEKWGQDLTQSKSIPSYGGAKVYKLCGDSYTNDATMKADHHWEAGVCAKCDDKQEAIFNTEKNSYAISNLGQLLWFDERFGLEGPREDDNANAFLTSDITINNAKLDYDGEQNKILVNGETDKESSLRGWKTLGSTHNFEGNGHTISGLYALTTTYSRNLTGFCNGEVQNLTLSNAVVIATSNDYIGGFSGRANAPINNCHFKGVVKGKYVGGIAFLSDKPITNCSFEGKIYDGKGGSKTLGGLVGENKGSITNCAFIGECIEENKIVRLVGTNSGTISNCYLSSSTSELGNEKLPCTIVGSNNGTIQKIAYDADKLTLSSEDEAFKAFTTEQIKSGEVAYWLNDSKSDGTQAWYQKLGENGDAYPMLTATDDNTVYHGTKCNKETDVYTNDNSIFDEDGSIPHNYEISNVVDGNGLYGDVCTECNASNESVKYIHDFCGEKDRDIKLAVASDGSYSTAETVILADGAAYNSPVNFTAAKVEYTRNYLGADQWQAVYVPFETQATDWTSNGITVASINNFHEYEKEDGSGYETVLEVKKATSGEFEASTPYVVRTSESGSKTITINNVKLHKAASETYYCMSMTRKYDFRGIYNPQSGLGQEESSVAVYALDKQGRIAPLSSSKELGAQRWYLTVSNRNGSSLSQESKSRTIRIDEIGEGAITGIEGIQVITSKEANSTSQTGIYDLQGRKLSKEPNLGIYIKNGKKYVK